MPSTAQQSSPTSSDHPAAPPPLRRYPARWTVEYAWRLFGTAVSFLTFGIGNILLSLTVLPALRLLPPKRRRRAARSVAAGGLRFFIWLMRRFGLIREQWTNLEELRKPGGKLIVVNHPSLIDALFLLARVPDITCVAKSAHWRASVIGTFVRMARHVSNSDTRTLIQESTAALQRGETVVMFPEGTRTPPDSVPNMPRGAAQIAVRAGAPIVPLVLHVSPPTLRKGEPWYNIPPAPAVYHFKAAPAWDPADYPQGANSSAARALNDRLNAHFRQALASPIDPAEPKAAKP